jgi:hypothetical protein
MEIACVCVVILEVRKKHIADLNEQKGLVA